MEYTILKVKFFTKNEFIPDGVEKSVEKRVEESSKESEEEKSKKKKKQRTKCKKGKPVHKKENNIEWKNFDDKTLKSLGIKLAQSKTGYEFGEKYDFREFFWEKEWNSIVNRSLLLPPVDKSQLVPLKKLISEKGDESKTDGYSSDK